MLLLSWLRSVDTLNTCATSSIVVRAFKKEWNHDRRALQREQLIFLQTYFDQTASNFYHQHCSFAFFGVLSICARCEAPMCWALEWCSSWRFWTFSSALRWLRYPHVDHEMIWNFLSSDDDGQYYDSTKGTKTNLRHQDFPDRFFLQKMLL
jgi:hypothetical protein